MGSAIFSDSFHHFPSLAEAIPDRLKAKELIKISEILNYNSKIYDLVLQDISAVSRRSQTAPESKSTKSFSAIAASPYVGRSVSQSCCLQGFYPDKRMPCLKSCPYLVATTGTIFLQQYCLEFGYLFPGKFFREIGSYSQYGLGMHLGYPAFRVTHDFPYFSHGKFFKIIE